MSMTKNEKLHRDYEREMLRSSFVSLFWSVFMQRKQEGSTLKDIADALGIHKSGVSRWFSGKSPNWEINTVADLSRVLDIELRITAVDRNTGAVFGPSGEISPAKPVVQTQANVVNLERHVISRTSGKQIDLREARAGA